VQLVSDNGNRSDVVSTKKWQASTFDRLAGGVEMRGVTWQGTISVPADFGRPGGWETLPSAAPN
jgi:hypothetical protein